MTITVTGKTEVRPDGSSIDTGRGRITGGVPIKCGQAARPIVLMTFGTHGRAMGARPPPDTVQNPDASRRQAT